MKYVILVSHGTFAPGLHSVLKMLAGGDRSDIISASMEDGMGADEFVRRFEEVTKSITKSDEIILLADIIGGSPLTNALDFLSQKGLLSKTIAFGGMNLPMALTAAMMKDGMDQENLRSSLLIEAKNAMMEMELRIKEDEDEI
ncbi:PTS sugar transporter subunit IIA [Lacrimispora algidixylanolytica]|uniref:PTS fructose transporter subunit IIA n=1 Tax=Lacrimispora algidixylanolytica TaxID=94868 RepID=A0A419T7R7_9FIRM|nr:PTS fructose transporter subunit IIA [Lacrimispora algidixylanolytica]RKD33600.1 PTS fructose transporter subunit IIA [Lacrimispora algidixylanolytica]